MAFDSDLEDEDWLGTGEVEYVKESDIINCNEFHEELERRLRERDKEAQWRETSQFNSNTNSIVQKIKGLEKVE